MVSLTSRTIIATVLIMLMLALSAAHAPSSEAPTNRSVLGRVATVDKLSARGTHQGSRLAVPRSLF